MTDGGQKIRTKSGWLGKDKTDREWVTDDSGMLQDDRRDRQMEGEESGAKTLREGGQKVGKVWDGTKECSRVGNGRE